METKSDAKKLAEATANLAGTILEIIDGKLKSALEVRGEQIASMSGMATYKSAEGWVGKKAVAKHFNISLRTVDNWMKKGVLPHIRLGPRKILFKLSEADEAFKRRFERNGLW